MALVGKGDGEEEGYCRRFSARTEVKSRRRNGRSFRPTAQFASGGSSSSSSSTGSSNSSTYTRNTGGIEYKDQNQNEQSRLPRLLSLALCSVLHQPYSQWSNPAHDAAEDFINTTADISLQLHPTSLPHTPLAPSTMRIRYPFAGAFILLVLIAAYIGLLPHSTSPSIPQQYQPNDKFLHLLTFFLLSLIFYWIFETSRRRALQLTLLVCTLALGVGSEILQGFLPNDRPFDPLDLVANLVGSLAAVGLNGWYHRRMLERRRNARYGSGGGGGPYADGENAEDVELGLAGGHGHDGEEGGERGLGPQETGVMSLEQEVDNWDEDAVDTWDTEDGVEDPGHGSGPQEGQKPGTAHESAAPAPPAASGEGKKRSD